MLTNVTNVMGTVENLKNIVNGNNSKNLQIPIVKAFPNLLECKIERTSPVVDIGRMPTSCKDLQRIGNKKNGFFSIMGQKKIQTVYCNFAKRKTDQSIKQISFEKSFRLNQITQFLLFLQISRI